MRTGQSSDIRSITEKLLLYGKKSNKIGDVAHLHSKTSGLC